MLQNTVFTLKKVTSGGKTYPPGSWLGISEAATDAKVTAGVAAKSFVLCPFNPNAVAVDEKAAPAAITVTVVEGQAFAGAVKGAATGGTNKLAVAVNGVTDLTFSGGTADATGVLTVTVKVDATADQVKTVNITVGMTDTALATAVATLTFTNATLTRSAKKVTLATSGGATAITKLTAVIA